MKTRTNGATVADSVDPIHYRAALALSGRLWCQVADDRGDVRGSHSSASISETLPAARHKGRPEHFPHDQTLVATLPARNNAPAGWGMAAVAETVERLIERILG
jgi:hypothetical protein